MNLHFDHNLKSMSVSSRTLCATIMTGQICNAVDRPIDSVNNEIAENLHTHWEWEREREIIKYKSAAIFYIEWVARNWSLWMNTSRLTYITIWNYYITYIYICLLLLRLPCLKWANWTTGIMQFLASFGHLPLLSHSASSQKHLKAIRLCSKMCLTQRRLWQSSSFALSSTLYSFFFILTLYNCPSTVSLALSVFSACSVVVFLVSM